MIIQCNKCWGTVAGLGYRTTCRHIFCSVCAQNSFGEGCSCPVCSTRLQMGDVSEVVVGSEVINSGLLESSLACAFSVDSGPKENGTSSGSSGTTKNTPSDWSQVLNQVNEVHSVAAETSAVLITQAIIQLQHKEEELDAMKNQLYQREQRWNTYSQSMKEQLVETQELVTSNRDLVAQRERQLQDFQCQLVEQQRKCSAWERAYSALRDQLPSSQSKAQQSGMKSQIHRQSGSKLPPVVNTRTRESTKPPHQTQSSSLHGPYFDQATQACQQQQRQQHIMSLESSAREQQQLDYLHQLHLPLPQQQRQPYNSTFGGTIIQTDIMQSSGSPSDCSSNSSDTFKSSSNSGTSSSNTSPDNQIQNKNRCDSQTAVVNVASRTSTFFSHTSK